MAGSTILKLALFASAALAMPFDLQELSHRHYSPGSNPPFPKFNPHAGEFPHNSVPIPTGTAVVPTGTSIPNRFAKRDNFQGFYAPPFATGAPSGYISQPTGFIPHPTGYAPASTGYFKEKRFAPFPTGTGGYPAPTGYAAPTGDLHDFEPPFPARRHQHQARQFEGPRQGGLKPYFPIGYGSGPEGPVPTATGTATAPPVPTAST
ncbi:hypothetical protein M409DRAFT_16046 [Zasmidium cellare ATCC 36951]|uniref:Uncharacterized protein n=1 Tax=Zasmidium cellare ATCC 36951 TaxID=1080233 RepID=A0A6A6D2Z2_ZASCE|nr:uncharacterized protein M409DRAFT_16046 [Zasmidium cellare ATCC 36951]KAF2173774.1 hypothetical protein M409DRAFT_16046 [Zasmidium cellare ATCC 36951]